MTRWLLLAFIVFPFVELYLLLYVGHQIGFWPTLGLTILSGVVGSVMAKREGMRVLGEWQRAVSELRPPEQGVLEGVLVMAGAVLLITPGMLSDVLGILFLVPFTRRLLAKPIRRAVQSYIDGGQLRVMNMGGPSAGAAGPGAAPSDPFGWRPDPFGRAQDAQSRSRGGVVETTGEAVTEAPRQLPR